MLPQKYKQQPIGTALQAQEEYLKLPQPREELVRQALEQARALREYRPKHARGELRRRKG